MRVTLVVAVLACAWPWGPSLSAQRPATAPASAGGASASSSDPAPKARIVRLDAIVVDEHGRPIPDLKPTDFEIVEESVAQKIDAVEHRGAEPAPQTAGPIVSLDDEQRAAQSPGVRVVALLLDEFHVSSGDSSERVRDQALRFVDALRPGDLLAVLKPLDSLGDIHFTRDRDAARRAIQSFNGRKGDYTALTEFEKKYIGRAAAAIEAARGQIVFSGLRALTMRLGELDTGRSAIVIVSEGFARDVGIERERRIPDVQGLVRAASRHNVAFYVLDPAAAAVQGSDLGASRPVPVLPALAVQTGGEAVPPGSDLAPAFTRIIHDLDSYYLLTYTSSHPADGRFYEVQVRAKPRGAHVRTRTGYWAPLRTDVFTSADARPAAPIRALKRSVFIDTWLGLTVGADGVERVMFTWQPAERRPGSRAPAVVASAVAVKAMTPRGAVLFEGEIRAPRGAPGPVTDEIAAFDAEPGTVQLDLTILGPDGAKIDTAAHDVEVPDVNRADPLILPPQVIAASSAREFRQFASDPLAAPVPSRTFRRTERLLLRVPVHSASGAPIELAARLVNRVGQTLRTLNPMRTPAPDGSTQFDLPLAWLAPGEYTIELSATSTRGTAREIVRFSLTG
jgi:VWFA-related protein